MRLKISHTTDYQLTEPTKYGLQQLRITPTTNALQTVKEWRVEMIGGKLETHYTDEHGALVHLASIEPESLIPERRLESNSMPIAFNFVTNTFS